MKILNLGSGENILPDCINVDIIPYNGVNQIKDLTIYPWPWKDGTVDGVYASHIIEHQFDQKQFILECHRILKKGGFLRIKVPHSSNISAVGCLGHYRTYSYDTLNDYLGRDFYYLGKQKFKTVEQKLLWWYEIPDTQKELPKWMIPIIKTVDYVLTRLANISPRVCENLWCYWVGGFREVVYTGIKL